MGNAVVQEREAPVSGRLSLRCWIYGAVWPVSADCDRNPRCWTYGLDKFDVHVTSVVIMVVVQIVLSAAQELARLCQQ